MIWIISNVEEEHGPFITFDEYKKAFEEGEMDIYVAKQNEDFSFLKEEDIVIMRTRDANIYSRLTEAQKNIGFKSTLESERTRFLTLDKEALKPLLTMAGVSCPKSYTLDEIVEGKTYFIKPRYGEDSIEVNAKSKCSCIEQVFKKTYELESIGETPIIEEFIRGDEITTSLLFDQDLQELCVYSSAMQPNNRLGFHTSETKKNYAFTPHLYENKELHELCCKIFKVIGAKHYIRIDSRIVDGVPFVIDVNLIAGLNKRGYMAKCLEVNGIGYFDFIRKVINTAS